MCNDECYRTLGCAIVCQAIKDYQNSSNKSEKNEIKKFFKSPWCEFVCGINGEEILSKINDISVPIEVF